MIAIKIDVTKIEKARLFKSDKTGSIYLDAVMIETPNSEFADYMIVQEVSKDERERGIKGNVLGNAKSLTPQPSRPAARPEPGPEPEPDSDIPF